LNYSDFVTAFIVTVYMMKSKWEN